MRARKELGLDDVLKNKDKLIKLSQLSKADIKKIFIRPGDVDIEDLDNMKYDWNIPLYAKHIFRFVNGGSQFSGMYWGLDPFGQQTLRFFAGFYGYDDNALELMDFFCWIKNSLGMVDILLLENLAPVKGENTWDDMEKKSTLIDGWKKNSITFFLELSEEMQLELLIKYNKMISKH